MKLCLPVSAPDGLDSLIEAHLPSAEHLFIFDTQTRAFEEIALREQDDDSPKPQFDAVLCSSIDRVTLRALLEHNIAVYGMDAPTVAQAIAQFENGELEAVQNAGHGCGGGCGGHAAHEHQGGGCGGHAQQDAGAAHGGCGGAGGCGGGGGGCGGHGHEHSHDHEHEHGHGHQGGGCCASRSSQQHAAARRAPGDTLRIAVSSQNRKTVTEHAGKCRKFWIYEIAQGKLASKTLLELPIEQSFHVAAEDQPHPLDSSHVLLTAGIGSGLQQRLLRRGIEGVLTTETDPDRAVAAYLSAQTAHSDLAETDAAS